MIKRRVRLKITATNRKIVRRAGRSLRARCGNCGCEVDIVTEGDAAGILQVDGLILDRLIADGQAHAVRTISSKLWVCKESLFLMRSKL